MRSSLRVPDLPISAEQASIRLSDVTAISPRQRCWSEASCARAGRGVIAAASARASAARKASGRAGGSEDRICKGGILRNLGGSAASRQLTAVLAEKHGEIRAYRRNALGIAAAPC